MKNKLVKYFKLAQKREWLMSADMIHQICHSKWWHKFLPCQCHKLVRILKQVKIEVAMGPEFKLNDNDWPEQFPIK